MTDATRYPLSWPLGWKRTPRGQQKRAKFSKGETRYGDNGHSWRTSSALTVPQGLQRLKNELERLGARSVIISTNVELNSYGEPRGGRREPDDSGAAVYFKIGGKDRVLACDCWDRTADNLASIAAHIECIRGIDRYGVGTLDQAFAGYDALPPPGAQNRPPWRKVLGLPADADVTTETVQSAYRELAKLCHPDLQGGSHEAMAQLNEARDAALNELAA
jgi:hypothetical protein